jgi:transcriptional regulator with XRE-family HTH domain
MRNVKPKNRNLSDQVRDAVRGSGLLAQEVADRSGIHKSAMSRFLAGERGLSIEGLDRLGQVLGLEIVARARLTEVKAGAGEGAGVRKKRRKLGKG